MSDVRFWDALDGAAKLAWQFCDDSWKVLRWIAASAATLSIYDQSGRLVALILGLILSIFAVSGLSAVLFSWQLRGLTKKGRNSGRGLTIVLAFAFFCLAIGFASIVWVATAATYVNVLSS